MKAAQSDTVIVQHGRKRQRKGQTHEEDADKHTRPNGRTGDGWVERQQRVRKDAKANGQAGQGRDAAESEKEHRTAKRAKERQKEEISRDKRGGARSREREGGAEQVEGVLHT